MTPKTWKAVELRVAKFLGTERNPLSGGNSKHTRSDSLHPRIFVETKHGGGCPASWSGIVKLFLATEVLAKKEGKTALVVLHRKGMSAVAEYDAYLRIFPGAGEQAVVACVPLVVARAILNGEMGASCSARAPPNVTLDDFPR